MLGISKYPLTLYLRLQPEDRDRLDRTIESKPPEDGGKAGSCVSSERRGKPTRADLSAYNIINHDGGH